MQALKDSWRLANIEPKTWSGQKMRSPVRSLRGRISTNSVLSDLKFKVFRYRFFWVFFKTNIFFGPGGPKSCRKMLKGPPRKSKSRPPVPKNLPWNYHGRCVSPGGAFTKKFAAALFGKIRLRPDPPPPPGANSTPAPRTPAAAKMKENERK